MFKGLHFNKLRKLSLENQVFALMLVAKTKVSAALISEFLEDIKGSPLTDQEAIFIRAIYKKLERQVDWGNKTRNDVKILALGISVREINLVMADILWDSLNLDKNLMP